MITISIEDDAIKIVATQGNLIKDAIVQPIEPGLVKEGVVLNPDAVGQIINQAFRESGIQDKNVIACVSGIRSIYRVVPLPKLSGDMMTQAIKGEISRLIPLPPEEIYTKWQVLHEGGDEVIAAIIGIPRETIDFVLSALRVAGLSAKIMDVKPLAIARVADEATAIIINVQQTDFDIVILVDGIPQIVRSLPFSENTSKPEDKKVEFMEELNRTVNFYNSSKTGRPISADTPVFISGQFKDIAIADITYPLKPLPTMLLYSDDFNIDLFTANVGLALKQGKLKDFPVKVNFNVLPAAYLPKPVSLVHMFSWLFIIFAAAILIFNIINLQQVMWKNSLLENQIKNLNLQVQSRTADKPDMDKLRAKLQTINNDQKSLQQLLNNFSQQREKLNKDLGIITSTVSGKIKMNSISYGDIWTVRGSAPDSSTVLNYVSSLQTGNRFAAVQLSSMSQIKYNQWDFVIVLSSLK